MNRVIYQKDYFGCGEACVRNIVKKLCGKSAAYQKLGDCSNFLLMKKRLSKFGICGTGYEYKKLDNIKKLKGEKIILIEKKGRKHFVYYIFQTKFFVVYFDPEEGIIISKISNFIKLSTKKILNCYKNEEIDMKSISFLKKSELILISLFASAEGFLFITSMYFSRQGDSYYRSIFCLVGLFILSFMNRSYLLSLYSKLQMRIGYEYIRVNSTGKKLNDITNFLTSIIKYYTTRINGIVILAVLSILALYLSPVDLFVILISIFFSLILFLTVKRFKEKFNRKLEIKERYLVTGNSLDKRVFFDYIKGGEKFGKYTVFENYLRISIAVFLSIISTVLTDSFGFFEVIARGVLIYYLNSKIVEFLNDNHNSDPYSLLIKLDENIYENNKIFKR